MIKFIGVYHPALDTTTVVAESAFERVHSNKGWERITANTPQEKILEAADALGIIRKKDRDPDFAKLVERINGGPQDSPAVQAEDPSTDEGDQSDGEGPEDETDPSGPDPSAEVDTRSPQQKAADTRRAQREAEAQQGEGSDNTTDGSEEG